MAGVHARAAHGSLMRVLFVRLSAMGDLVQSLGAMQALRAARPDWPIQVCTQSTLAPLLEQQPGAWTVIAHDRRGGLRALLATRRRLRELGCEVAVDLQGNWKSALLARLAGAPVVGAAARWRQEPTSSWLLGRRLAIAGPRHPALVAATLVQALAPEAIVQRPRLFATEAEVQAAARTVALLGIEAARPFRVVVVSNPADPRALRPTRLAELANGQPTLLLAGPAEEHVQWSVAVPTWRQRPGELRRLVGLGVMVHRLGGDVVGPDQGATHVLAACGASTTVLFGPQDPARTAPPAVTVLQRRELPPCAPCGRRVCHHPDGPVCMDFGIADGAVTPLPPWLRSP
ncbi:MAG: glycosyltransferase family 9 protein [Planctomycetes bacterium]|nr:glycosyltransferase family 9 protein [Planctomycetota bacterium]